MQQDEINRRAMDLVDAVRTIFEAELAKAGPNSAQLERALALMQELGPDPDPASASTLPVCRHLPRALDIGETGPAAEVAAALRDIAPALTWAQNPRYNAANKGADFMDNYGWSGLGLVSSDALSFGILLLGPGITYPPTSYPSEGIFLMIAGAPEWKSGDDPWLRVEDGSIVCRPFGGAEGKRAGAEPMLALYAWMYSQS